MAKQRPDETESRPPMTAADAGRAGGRRTVDRHGPEHFRAIGRKGGQRLADLIAKGRAAETTNLQGAG